MPNGKPYSSPTARRRAAQRRHSVEGVHGEPAVAIATKRTRRSATVSTTQFTIRSTISSNSSTSGRWLVQQRERRLRGSRALSGIERDCGQRSTEPTHRTSCSSSPTTATRCTATPAPASPCASDTSDQLVTAGDELVADQSAAGAGVELVHERRHHHHHLGRERRWRHVRWVVRYGGHVPTIVISANPQQSLRRPRVTTTRRCERSRRRTAFRCWTTPPIPPSVTSPRRSVCRSAPPPSVTGVAPTEGAEDRGRARHHQRHPFQRERLHHIRSALRHVRCPATMPTHVRDRREDALR